MCRLRLSAWPCKKLLSSKGCSCPCKTPQGGPAPLRPELGKCTCANTPVCTHRRKGGGHPGVTCPERAWSRVPVPHSAAWKVMAEARGGSGWRPGRIWPLLLSGVLGPGTLQVRPEWDWEASSARPLPAPTAPSDLCSVWRSLGFPRQVPGEGSEAQRGRTVWLKHTGGRAAHGYSRGKGRAHLAQPFPVR